MPVTTQKLCARPVSGAVFRREAHALTRRVLSFAASLTDAPPAVAAGIDMLMLWGTCSPHEAAAWEAHWTGWTPPGTPVILGAPLGDPSRFPLDYRWSYQGTVLQPSASMRLFQARLLGWLYPDSPARWKADRATLKRALDFLLDSEGPLWIPQAPSQGRSRSLSFLLHQAFIEPGLLRPVQSEGGLTRYEVADGSAQRPEGRLFRGLLEKLYGDPQAGRPPTLQELRHWLAQPPRGLRGLPAELYLAAALRCHARDLRLAGQDGEEPLPMSPAGLARIRQAPARWRLEYHPADRHEQAWLLSISRLFGQGSEAGNLSADLWRRSALQLQAWWGRLPLWTRANLEAHSLKARALGEICLAAPGPNPRELLGRSLPQAFRCSRFPRVEEQSLLLDRIDAGRLELEGYVQSQYDLLMTRLYTLFTSRYREPRGSRAWFEQGARQWLSGLPPGTLTKADLSPWALGVRQALAGTGDPDLRWFEELPPHLGLPGLSQWRSDQSVVFLARLARALLELRLWTVQQVLPPEPEAKPPAEAVGLWIREALRGAGLGPVQAERILFELLEELYRRTG